jgi:hypothetical protein
MNRAVVAWVFVTVWIAVSITVWYITEPIVYTLSAFSIDTARTAGANTTGFEQGIQLVQTINVAWLGIVMAILIIYAIAVSVQREGIGEYQSMY